MSTEALKKFTLVGAHRQLHANAAKELARLENLIESSSDVDEIVKQAQTLALATSAADIFEQHLEAHHSGRDSRQNQPPAQTSGQDPAKKIPNRQEVVDKVKKLTEARGSVPLVAPHSQSRPAASVRNPQQSPAQGKKANAGRNSGNTAKNKKDLYGEKQ